MPQPTCKQDLQRFLGMTTYLSKFLPQYSAESAPLRKLLEKDVEWVWDDPQSESFEKLKKMVSDAPVLKKYDVNKPVKIATDASGLGIGSVLLQDNQPVAYTSKSLTDTQQRYVSIEREMLAIVHACTKFHQYIYGKPVTVITDHKPLEAIFKKPLRQCPARLQNMRLILQKYDLKVVYSPGKSEEMIIPDTLSRAHIEDTFTDYDEQLQVCMVLSASKEKVNEIVINTECDPTLRKLMSTVRNGWPDTQTQVDKDIRVYWSFRDELSVYNGIIFKGEQMIIPSSMRDDMLSQIHRSHLGITLCQNRAKDVIYWPGMLKDIENIVKKCQTCNELQYNNQKEPLIPEEVPEKPWQKVGTDLFELDGEHYIVIVDYYSGFFEISTLSDQTSETTIKHMKSQFARHGIPEIVVSDNGPQYTSHDFEKFKLTYGFSHITSSPKHPKSNGMAENSVKIAKRLLKKAKLDGQDPYLALLDYRNTPRDNKLGSPAQRLFGRRTRTTMPIKDSLLVPKQIPNVKSELEKKRGVQKSYHDKSAKKLPVLHPGDTVRYKSQPSSTWKQGLISHKHPNPRSYVIKTADGKTLRRNRVLIRKTNEDLLKKPDINAQEPTMQVYIPETPRISSTPSTPTKSPVNKQFTPSRKTSAMPKRQIIQPQQKSPIAKEPTVSTTGRVIKKPVWAKDYEM